MFDPIILRLLLFLFIFHAFSSFNFERDIARILKEQELVTKRMKEFEDGLAASKPPTSMEAKVGFAAIQEMARLQEQDQLSDDPNQPNNLPSLENQQLIQAHDLSFLRFDPSSNRMTLESTKSPSSSVERPAKFPLEIPTPVTSPNPGHKLRKMGSWRLDFDQLKAADRQLML